MPVFNRTAANGRRLVLRTMAGRPRAASTVCRRSAQQTAVWAVRGAIKPGRGALAAHPPRVRAAWPRSSRPALYWCGAARPSCCNTSSPPLASCRRRAAVHNRTLTVGSRWARRRRVLLSRRVGGPRADSPPGAAPASTGESPAAPRCWESLGVAGSRGLCRVVSSSAGGTGRSAAAGGWRSCTGADFSSPPATLETE